MTKKEMKELKKAAAMFVNMGIVCGEAYSNGASFKASGKSCLQYYTNLSNLLQMVSSIVYLLIYQMKLYRYVRLSLLLRYAATVSLLVTFLTVVFVLIPSASPKGSPEGTRQAKAKEMLFEGPAFYLHFLCPILSFLSFVLFEDSGEEAERLHMDDVLWAASPTFAYAVIFSILNLLKKVKGPYVFLHVYEQPWYISVMWMLVIPGGSVLFALAVKALRDLLRKAA